MLLGAWTLQGKTAVGQMLCSDVYVSVLCLVNNGGIMDSRAHVNEGYNCADQSEDMD